MARVKKLTDDERRQLAEWAKKSLAGVEESGSFIAVLDEGDLTAARAEFTLQIGHAVLTDKPLIITVPQGVKVPEKLRKVADRVVVYNRDNPASLPTELARALTEMGIKKQ